MKKTILLALFLALTFCNTSNAQDWQQLYDQGKQEAAAGNHKAAVSSFEKALPLAKKSYQKEKNNANGVNYLFNLNDLGLSYYYLGDYKRTEEIFTENITLCQSIYGDRHPNFITMLGNTAGVYKAIKKYDKAASLYQIALDIAKETKGDKSIEYANALKNLADLYRISGQLDKAEPLYKQSVALADANGANNTSEYGIMLNNIGLMYYNRGEYATAESYYNKALPVIETKEGASSENLFTVYSNLLNCYIKTKTFAKAEPLAVKIMNSRSQAKGERNAEYAADLSTVAYLYEQMNQPEKAELYYGKIVLIYRDYLGNKHSQYADALRALADIAAAKGRYEEAETKYLEALQVYKQTVGYKDPSYGVCFNNLALLYDNMGQYEKAEAMYLDSETQSATGLNNLASVYAKQGKYPQAEALYMKVLDMEKVESGENSIKYATSLNNVGLLYADIGNYAKADQYYKQASQIAKQQQGEKSVFYSTCLNNMANLYSNMERDAEAEPLYRKALAIREEILGKMHPDYGTSLNNLAMFYYGKDNYAQAEPLFEQALAIFKAKLGENHPSYATTMSNLASVFKALGKYEKAEPLCVQVLKIRKNALGEEHPDYAAALSNLAFVYANLKKNKEAEPLFQENVKVRLKQIQNYFPALSEKEKELFYKTIQINFKHFNDFALLHQTTNPAILGDMYNIQLATKALLLNSTNKVKHRILNSNDDELIKQYNQWIDRREYLAKVYKMSSKDLKAQNINVLALEEEANALEKELNLNSEAFRNSRDNKLYTWQDVQRKLHKDEAAVEIIRIDDGKKVNGRVTYIGLVVTPQTKGNPQLVLFPNGNDMESKFLKYYKNSVSFKQEDEFSYKRYWSPIAAALPNAKKVYLSLDGVFTQINPNTLYNADKQTFVLEEMQLQIVSNTKDLINFGKKSDNKSNFVALFGFPDYRARQGKAATTASTERGSSTFTRSVTDSLERYVGTRLTDLPGTKVEVENVETILNKKHKVQKYLGTLAAEDQIKLIQNPRLLHIATHGFFIKDALVNENEKTAENPLLRSGLLLAGAAYGLKGSSNPNADDGILTAYEVMNLNLDNTDLVILSACETGLGEVKNGEGVYGLQRAFQVAGAKTLIMSLWKVNDQATQELMTHFYENWLASGNQQLAFKNAQQQIKTKYPQPYFWGAFVMIGQ